MMEQDPRKTLCATAAQGANLIGGSWVPGAGPQARDIRNPADTDECLAEVREASSDQVNER